MESEKENLRDTKELYEFLPISISECTELARVLKFDKTHKWHVKQGRPFYLYIYIR